MLVWDSLNLSRNLGESFGIMAVPAHAQPTFVTARIPEKLLDFVLESHMSQSQPRLFALYPNSKRTSTYVVPI